MTNRFAAAHYLTCIIAVDPALCDMLMQYGAGESLSLLDFEAKTVFWRRAGIDSLLAPSRKVLIALQETHLLSLIKNYDVLVMASQMNPLDNTVDMYLAQESGQLIDMLMYVNEIRLTIPY
jgi:hypothetical protein